MIKSIEHIKKFGIYENYLKSTKLSDFKRFNLFYGWNGSGKSTLSRLFQVLESKNIHDDFQDAEFNFVLENSQQITHKNLNDFSSNIFVFNKNFVETNIEWNGTIKSILLLSEEKINETKEYEKLKRELYGSKNENLVGKIDDLSKAKKTLDKKEDENIKKLTTIAKNIKMSLQIISTNDSYYSNYNKTKVESFISNYGDELRKGTEMLKSDEIERLAKQASPMKMGTISEVLTEVIIDNAKNIQSQSEEILCRIVTAEVIKKLEENLLLSDWVEKGLEIHNNENSIVICEFCGNQIEKDRITKLENHYNNQMKRIKNDIHNLQAFINKNLMLDVNTLTINKQLFYPEYQEIVESYNQKNIGISEKIKLILNDYLRQLKEKEENPFTIVENQMQEELTTLYLSLNDNLSKIKETIDDHNKKSKNFDSTITEAKKKLEFHYLSQQLRENKYFKVLSEIELDKSNLKKEEDEIKDKEKKVKELEAILSNESLGAEEFNKKLERFIGYSEIKLSFNRDKRGYQIIRNDSGRVASNLSEGEKTSIAFIYFMTKIKENGNRISDSIVVIDDPISSFDSNKIFHSYAYLKHECKGAKQLFVLTHNYNYYYLVLGWFKKETICDSSTNKKIPNWLSYKIEPELIDGKRTGKIMNAGVGLMQTTEYDYVFYNVYRLKGKILTGEEKIYCGNIARKLVESFLSFKFPNQRGDFDSLLEAAYKELASQVDNGWLKKEEIYKFTNLFSHSKKIMTFEEIDSDVIETSSTKIIDDIFEMMVMLDKNHYIAMENWAKKEIACC